MSWLTLCRKMCFQYRKQILKWGKELGRNWHANQELLCFVEAASLVILPLAVVKSFKNRLFSSDSRILMSAASKIIISANYQ